MLYVLCGLEKVHFFLSVSRDLKILIQLKCMEAGIYKYRV